MSKNDLRQSLKLTRSNIFDRAKKDIAIREALFLFLNENFANLKDIFIYESFCTEVDTWGIMDEALNLGYNIFTPKVDKDFNMSAVCRFTGEQAKLAPAITITPLLGFNEKLDRIGFGKGCYDKYFEKYSYTLKIGLAYFEQRCNFLPNPHDIPLDFIVTPMVILKSESNIR